MLTTENNICRHLMTHKEDLAQYIVINSDPFATIRKEDTEYNCCFGCKKSLKDKTKLRIHMKGSESCRAAHKQFLQDIGVNTSAIEQIHYKNHENQTIRELQGKIDLYEERIKDYQDGSIFKARIDYLDKSLHQATSHVARLEEMIRLVPYFIQPKLWTYCNQFREDYNRNHNAIIPGEEKQTRREQYVHLIKKTPLLQLFFSPSFSFLQNQHAQNGEYEGILCGYFNKLSYMPSLTPTGDPDTLPPLPESDIKKAESKYLQKLAAEESKPTPEPETKAETSRSAYPPIIQSSKRPPKQVPR
jgi:hypothetical protein